MHSLIQLQTYNLKKYIKLLRSKSVNSLAEKNLEKKQTQKYFKYEDKIKNKNYCSIQGPINMH